MPYSGASGRLFMSQYRYYCVDHAGGIAFAEWINSISDEAAVAIVRGLKKNALQCEVWEGNRLVAELNARELAG